MTPKIANYTRFLTRNYCITAHLAERLDELQDMEVDDNLKSTIASTVSLMEQHIDYANETFASLNLVMSFSENDPLVRFLENLFVDVRAYKIGFSALSLLDYISAAGALLQESTKLANLLLMHVPGIQLSGSQFDSSPDLQSLRTLLQQSTVTV